MRVRCSGCSAALFQRHDHGVIGQFMCPSCGALAVRQVQTFRRLAAALRAQGMHSALVERVMCTVVEKSQVRTCIAKSTGACEDPSMAAVAFSPETLEIMSRSIAIELVEKCGAELVHREGLLDEAVEEATVSVVSDLGWPEAPVRQAVHMALVSALVDTAPVPMV